MTYPRRNIKTSKGGKEKRKRERKVTREKKTKLNNHVVRALSYFTDYFAIPYPLPKLDMLAIPDFSAGAMENW